MDKFYAFIAGRLPRALLRAVLVQIVVETRPAISAADLPAFDAMTAKGLVAFDNPSITVSR